MPIHDQRQFAKVTRGVMGQLFGLIVRKARKNSILPLEAIANRASMGADEWLAIEAGEVPDPSQLALIAAVLGLRPDRMATIVQICQGAWTS
jgi:transcriptional regulator with XRE-family HTH domain